MAKEAPLPEPKTPMWLPALGAALFLGAGVWWLATAKGPEATDADAGAAAAAAPAPDAGAAPKGH